MAEEKVEEHIDEAREAMPKRLLAMLTKSKADCIALMHKRDVMDFSLEWHPGSESNDLTDVQARAIWSAYGLNKGASIRLWPAPDNSTDCWMLDCDQSERRILGKDLELLLFPGEGG